MDSRADSPVRRPIHYDAARRRLWILGQRCHHGATGALLTGAALAGLAAARMRPFGCAAMAATGSLLMAHDWSDRSMWFERGAGTQA